MPKVSGMQILDIMRDDNVLRHVPVIVLTSTHDPQVKLQALSAGAMDFLSKPVDPSELALRIRNTLAATAYRDYLAQHDPLTGLPNKLRYKEAVKEAVEKAQSVPPRRKGALSTSASTARRHQRRHGPLGRRPAAAAHRQATGQLRADRSARRAEPPSISPTLYRFDGDEFAVHAAAHGGHARPPPPSSTGCWMTLRPAFTAAAPRKSSSPAASAWRCSPRTAKERRPDHATPAWPCGMPSGRAATATNSFRRSSTTRRAPLDRGADLRIAFTRDEL